MSNLAERLKNRVVVFTMGGGTNGTAMMIDCIKQKIRIDYILFADTGGEHPRTYENIQRMSDYAESHGYPPITIVRSIRARGDLKGTFEGLENSCTRLEVLPAIAYGRKTCSIRWKIEPQDKFLRNEDKCKAEWAAGRSVVKIIGYDAGESHRMKDYDTDKFENVYPLVEDKIDRDGCVDIIVKEGMEEVGKSSCFFCPHMKKHEVYDLKINNPDLFKRGLEMESKWRNGDKFCDGAGPKGLGRSYSWTEIDDSIEAIEENQYEIDYEMPCECID